MSKKLEEMSKDELMQEVKSQREKKVKALARFTRTDKEIIFKEMNNQKIALMQSMPTEGDFNVVEMDLIAIESGELETVQEPGKVAGFYKNELLKLGYIKQA